MESSQQATRSADGPPDPDQHAAASLSLAASEAAANADVSVVVSTNGSVQKKRKFAHTSDTQRRVMLEWLEQPGNFELLASRSGAAGARHADGKKVKKTDGFRALMRHVNTHTGASWSMDITKSRFESLLLSYRKVKAQAQPPAFEPSPNDRARGITDVTRKLNTLCRFYDRIDALHARLSGHENKTSENETSFLSIADEVISSEELTALADVQMNQHGRLQPDEAASVELGSIASDQGESLSVEEENATTAGSAASAMPAGTVTADPSVTPSPSPADAIAVQQLALEREKLALQQEQLAVQKRELEVKALELQQQEQQKRTIMRADLTVKLAQAGKSVAEIKELLELIG